MDCLGFIESQKYCLDRFYCLDKNCEILPVQFAFTECNHLARQGGQCLSVILSALGLGIPSLMASGASVKWGVMISPHNTSVLLWVAWWIRVNHWQACQGLAEGIHHIRIQRNLKIQSDISKLDGKKRKNFNFKPIFVVQWSQTGSG